MKQPSANSTFIAVFCFIIFVSCRKEIPVLNNSTTVVLNRGYNNMLTTKKEVTVSSANEIFPALRGPKGFILMDTLKARQ